MVSIVATAACGSRSDLALLLDVPADSGSSPAAGPEASAGDVATPEGSVDGSPAPAPTQALVLNECGPADGAAVSFFFSTGPLACPPPMCLRGTCPPDPAPPTRDVIQIYGALAPGPSTVAFSPGGPNGPGDASSCQGGRCIAATRVELTLTTFTATGQVAGVAEGSYTLWLVDGSSVAGRFAGVICGNGTFCG